MTAVKGESVSVEPRPARIWRVQHTASGQWIVERTTLNEIGQETRELFAVYLSRVRAEQAIVQAMREERPRRPIRALAGR